MDTPCLAVSPYRRSTNQNFLLEYFLWLLLRDSHLVVFFFPVSCQSRLHVARAWNCLVHLHASTSARPLNLISFWDRVYHYIRRCLVQKVARILNGFMLDRVTIQIVFATTLESSPSTPCIDGFMDNERVLHLRRDNYLITLSTSSCSARNLEYSPVEAVPRPTQVVVVEQVKPLELELGRMR